MAFSDYDIGIPTPANLAKTVDVQNFDSVIAEVKKATLQMEEAVAELEKIKVGTGITLGIDLDDAG